MAVLSEKNLEKRYQDKSVSFSSYDHLGNCWYMFVVADKHFHSKGYLQDMQLFSRDLSEASCFFGVMIRNKNICQSRECVG